MGKRGRPRIIPRGTIEIPVETLEAWADEEKAKNPNRRGKRDRKRPKPEMLEGRR